VFIANHDAIAAPVPAPAFRLQSSAGGGFGAIQYSGGAGGGTSYPRNEAEFIQGGFPGPACEKKYFRSHSLYFQFHSY
jgi:hypothetical protein